MSNSSAEIYKQRLKAVAEFSNLGVWDINIQTGAYYANDIWWQMLGYEPKEEPNNFDLFFRIIHPEDKNLLQETFDQLKPEPGKDSFDILIRLKHKNGDYRFIQDRGQVFEWHNKEAIRAIGTHLDVTERHYFNEESETNKHRLEAAIRGANLGVWDTHLITGKNFANDRWWQMLGYEPDEVENLYDLFYERIHPEDAIKVNEAIDSLRLNEKDKFDLLIRIRHKNGNYLYLQDKAQAVEWDKDGKAVRLVGTHLDVTETQELNNQIKFHRTRLESAIRGADLGVWDSNVETGMNYANDRWWTMFGYEPNEVENSFDLFFEIVHPDDGQLILDSISALRPNKNQGFDLLVRVKHKNGKWRYIQDRGHVVEWKNNKAIRLIGTHLDVTENIELTEKLKFNEARLDSAINGADLGVWDVNVKTGEQYANDRWYQMLGFDRNEVDDIYEFFNGRVHSQDLPLLLQEISNLTQKGKNSFDLTLRVKHKDGSYRYIQDRSQAVEWENGNVIRAIGTHLDVTEIHELYNELKLNEARLDTAIHGADLGVWDIDYETGKVITNSRWSQMLGLGSPTTPITVEFLTYLIHPEDRDSCLEAYEKLEFGVMQGVDMVVRLRHQNGDYIHVLNRGQVIEWKNKKAKRIIGTNLDVTAQVIHEQNLSNALNERNNILESIDNGFLSIDESLNIIYCNSSAIKILGTGTAPLKGYLPDFFETELKEKLQTSIKEVAQFQKPSSFEIHDNANFCWLRFSIYTKDSGYGIFIQDITETKMFHEKMLENSIRSMENERNRISKELHDGVLQELTAAMMFSENLKHKIKSEDLAKHFERLSSLIKKIANDTRRISHDLKAPELEKNTFKDLIKRLIDDVNLSTTIKFQAEFDESLKNIRLGERIKINAFRIVQELILNIIKHSKTPTASVSVRVVNNILFIQVRDFGQGIQPNSNEKSGIGLKNINERINQIDGTFHMENAEHGGLISTIKIPL